MPKTKIDVQKVINIIDTTLDELKTGIINSDFTKTESENIRKELEDVIALAEEMKANIPSVR